MTKVYGASDDLIELEGTISGEIDCYREAVNIYFPDGTEIQVKYGKKYNGESIGVWQIKVITKGTGFIELRECFDEGADIYSDVLTLDDSVNSYTYGFE